MGVRVAYGQKENIGNAIEAGKIPTDSIIITKDDDGLDSELMFYDAAGNMQMISKRTRFETFTEAEQWVKTYPSNGFIVTIHNGSEWLPYIVQSDNSLAPFKGSVTDTIEIKRIDGGNSAGV